MIRCATDADGSALFAMARAMIAEAPHYRDAQVDAYRLSAMIDKLTADGTLLVAMWPDGGIAGFIGFLVAPNWLTGAPEACDVALYVEPPARGASIAYRLVVAAETEAGRRGCVAFHAGTSTGALEDATESVYVGAGFAPMGRTYRKSLAPSPAPA